MHQDRTKFNTSYVTTMAQESSRQPKGIGITVLGLVIVVLSITGCKSAPPAEPEFYGAQIGIVNHTDRFIDSASVGGGGGGHASGYHAGVANICCARVPEKWHPGLQLSVQWNMPLNGAPVIKEKIVNVEKYDEPGSVYVHFFPDDQVRIVVTRWAGFSHKHPIPPPPEELYENLKKLKKQNKQ